MLNYYCESITQTILLFLSLYIASMIMVYIYKNSGLQEPFISNPVTNFRKKMNKLKRNTRLYKNNHVDNIKKKVKRWKRKYL